MSTLSWARLMSAFPSRSAASSITAGDFKIPALPCTTGSGSTYAPHIESNTLTAQTDNKVPKVTGRNAAANAHHSTSVNLRSFRCSAKIMQPAKQIVGVTTTVSIQNKGVADQSTLNPLVAKYSQAAASHIPEQTINATETAARET